MQPLGYLYTSSCKTVTSFDFPNNTVSPFKPKTVSRSLAEKIKVRKGPGASGPEESGLPELSNIVVATPTCKIEKGSVSAVGKPNQLD